MRVEEMYFIEAEAAERLAPGTGITLLENFMKTYRDKQYVYTGSNAIDEILSRNELNSGVKVCHSLISNVQMYQ